MVKKSVSNHFCDNHFLIISPQSGVITALPFDTTASAGTESDTTDDTGVPSLLAFIMWIAIGTGAAAALLLILGLCICLVVYKRHCCAKKTTNITTNTNIAYSMHQKRIYMKSDFTEGANNLENPYDNVSDYIECSEADCIHTKEFAA